MSDHYYTPKPIVDHDRRRIETELRGRMFTFVTDAGVFSKEGVDFGSKLLIETMDIPQDAVVLDVGCGYGPIGLTAAALAVHGSVTMIDINERAVELAKENARLNRMERAEILQSDLFSALQGRTFTRILTNPPIRAGKEIVHRIFSESVQHLSCGGQLWVVIQKKQGAPSAFAKLQTLFAHVEEVVKAKGYRIYRASKKC